MFSFGTIAENFEVFENDILCICHSVRHENVASSELMKGRVTTVKKKQS